MVHNENQGGFFRIAEFMEESFIMSQRNRKEYERTYSLDIWDITTRISSTCVDKQMTTIVCGKNIAEGGKGGLQNPRRKICWPLRYPHLT